MSAAAAQALVPTASPCLAPAPPWRVEIDQLGDQIALLSAQINAARYQLLELIREFDERKGWAAQGALSCSQWLGWRCGTALGAAREKVRVAHALAELPTISEAFRDGQVSYSKVRAMTRVATPENEQNLLVIAQAASAQSAEQPALGREIDDMLRIAVLLVGHLHPADSLLAPCAARISSISLGRADCSAL